MLDPRPFLYWRDGLFPMVGSGKPQHYHSKARYKKFQSRAADKRARDARRKNRRR